MDNIRYCIKCGTELLSSNKGKKCNACKRKAANTIRRTCFGLLALFAAGEATRSYYDKHTSDLDTETDDDSIDESET